MGFTGLCVEGLGGCYFLSVLVEKHVGRTLARFAFLEHDERGRRRRLYEGEEWISASHVSKGKEQVDCVAVSNTRVEDCEWRSVTITVLARLAHFIVLCAGACL